MIYVLIAIIGIILQSLFIKVEHAAKYVGAVILKGSSSLMFVVFGFITSRLSTDASFAKSVLTGLILGAAGDILLNLRFVFPKIGSKIFLVGIAVFMSGHILYLCALLPRCTNKFLFIAIGAALTAFLIWWIFKQITAKMAFKIFGIFYIGAIAIMTCVAVGCLIYNPCKAFLLYVIGAVCFTVSDIILILNTFGGESKFSRRIMNLGFYYIGQLLIAFSLLFI